MADRFALTEPGLSDPAFRHFTITPGASNFAQTCRAIYVSVAGTATIKDIDGTSVDYTLAAGQVLPLRALAVTAATATLIGWY